jgi:hypothetical protein
MRLIKSLLYLAGIAKDRCDFCGEPARRRTCWYQRETECAECIKIDRELEAEERAAEMEERALEAVRQMTTAGVPRVREITLREAEAAAWQAISEAHRRAQIFGGSALLLDVDDEPAPIRHQTLSALNARLRAHLRPPPQPPMPGKRRD